MSNPWDVPPIPNRGDFDEDTTFAGVGRVMSGWELIEVDSVVFTACLLGVPTKRTQCASTELAEFSATA